MHVTIGTKGPLPFLRFLQPLYNHSHVYCWLCYMLFFIRKYGINKGEFKHEVRQFQKPYDNQQAEQISLMV